MYGGSSPELTLSYSGWLNGDSAADLEESPAVDAPFDGDVGAHAITLAGGTDDNYELDLVEGALEITPATLVISAHDLTVTYGDAIPTMAMNYSGFVNGDDDRDIETPIGTTSAQQGDVPGVYPITLEGGLASNYELVLEGSTLEISKAELIVEAMNDTIAYGERMPTPQVRYLGFVGDDSADTLTTAPMATILAGEGERCWLLRDRGRWWRF